MALFARNVCRSRSVLSMTTRQFVGVSATEGILPAKTFPEGQLTAYTQSAQKSEMASSRTSFVGVDYAEGVLPTVKTSNCSGDLTCYTLSKQEMTPKSSKMNVSVNVEEIEIPLPLLRALEANGALHY